MPGLIEARRQDVLNHIFTDPAWTVSGAGTLYLALSTTTPTDTGTNITEPSGNAYARVSTVAADWSAASAGSGSTPAQKTNTAVKTFPQATGSWGTVTHFVIFSHITTATTAETVLYGALTTSKLIGNGDTASFAASALVIQLGDPGDSY
jgi:hypothetical protein